MKSVKPYVTAVLATTALATIVLVATGTGSAVASQISSVFITNTASSPVPVQATGTVPVHEQATANVNVTNATVPVHEQGTAAVRIDDAEVSVTRLFGNDSGSSCGGPIYSVPAGQELVLEYIAAGNGFGPANGSEATTVHGELFGGTSGAFLPLIFFSQGAHSFFASEAVHYVIPAGTLQFAGGEGGNPTCGFQVSIGGHLQPLP